MVIIKSYTPQYVVNVVFLLVLHLGESFLVQRLPATPRVLLAEFFNELNEHLSVRIVHGPSNALVVDLHFQQFLALCLNVDLLSLAHAQVVIDRFHRHYLFDVFFQHRVLTFDVVAPGGD